MKIFVIPARLFLLNRLVALNKPQNMKIENLSITNHLFYIIFV